MINVSAMLDLYRKGLFPMGDPDSGKLYVVDPDPRTIIPLDAFHMSKTLAKKVRTRVYPTTLDASFKDVMKACAERPRKWITPDMEEAYLELHRRGSAHSVEAWKEGALAGGVFGLAIGGAFMAESMFHHLTDGGESGIHQKLGAGGLVIKPWVLIADDLPCLAISRGWLIVLITVPSFKIQKPYQIM